VILPAARPGLVAGAMLAAVTAIGEFVASVVLYTHSNRPISVEILAQVRSLSFGTAAAYSVLLIVLVLLITIVSRWFGMAGGDKFFSWQNLWNSLAQAIVIVGLLAVGQTMVIIAGALDISVGSIASIGSVVAASVLVGVGTVGALHILPRNSVFFAVLGGMLAGAIAGLINGLIVTKLRVNATIATLGTLAAFAGFAFLLAPEGKPIGVVTQPAFTWLAQGRLLTWLPIPPLGGSRWTGIPVLTIIFLVVALLIHVVMTYTDYGRAIYAIGANATAARLAGINLTRVRVLMYVLSGSIAGLAGVLLTSRTTSGNPINGTGLELQAITAVFLGGAATAGGKGTIFGTFLAVILVGILNNGMNLLGFNTFAQRVALGLLLVAAVAVSQWRQARAEHVRTQIAAKE
jgi:ribose transport system permease protein/L-arabinose transport system permease protein